MFVDKILAGIAALGLAITSLFTPTPTDTENLGDLRVITAPQGGTGIGSVTAGDVGDCLIVLSNSPFSYELGPCGTGGGGGGAGFPTYVQVDAATQNSGGTTTLNFTSNSFALTESPADTFTFRIATTTLGLRTTNVSEGSNLYYTDARVSSYMSASSTYTDLLSFYTTPSTRITAGTGIDWTGNTLNGVYTAGDALTLTGEDFDFDGGNTPAGALGGTWASPTVDDDGHNHTSATLSGIDISADTNLSGDTEVVLTGDALSLGTALTFTTGTSSTAFQTGLLGVGTDYISDITGTNLSITNGVLNATGGAADGVSNWLYNGSRLSPSTTVGIGVFASSTLSDLNFTNATGTNATSSNLSILNRLSFNGVVGATWASFCTAITGDAGLCDGVDNTAAGGGGIATSTAIANTEVIYGTSASTVGSEAAFTYNATTNLLTATNASFSAGTTTNATSSILYVSSLLTSLNSLFTNATTTNLYVSNDLRRDGVPDADDTFSGESTNSFNSGDTVAQWDLVYIGSAGTWRLTDADAAGSSTGKIGFAAEAGSASNPMRVVESGTYVRNDAWNWTVGATLYVGTTTSGTVTEIVPTGTSDVIRVVGYAVSADVVYFYPEPSYITHI